MFVLKTNCMYGITFLNSSYFCIALSSSAPDGATSSVTSEQQVWAEENDTKFYP